MVQETWFFKKKLSPKKSFPAPQIMENESYVALLSILASVLIKEDVYIMLKDVSCTLLRKTHLASKANPYLNDVHAALIDVI